MPVYADGAQNGHPDATHSPHAYHQPANGPSEPSYPSYSHTSPAYPPHASSSHTRSSSPPVTLAPIQTDRLVRGDALQTPLPTLSSTTSLASPSHYHHVARTSSAAQQQQQQLQHHQQQQQQQHVASPYSSVHHPSHSPHSAVGAHDSSQVSYSYSSYSALSPSGNHHSNWRPETFRRSSLAV